MERPGGVLGGGSITAIGVDGLEYLELGQNYVVVKGFVNGVDNDSGEDVQLVVIEFPAMFPYMLIKSDRAMPRTREQATALMTHDPEAHPPQACPEPQDRQQEEVPMPGQYA